MRGQSLQTHVARAALALYGETQALHAGRGIGNAACDAEITRGVTVIAGLALELALTQPGTLDGSPAVLAHAAYNLLGAVEGDADAPGLRPHPADHPTPLPVRGRRNACRGRRLDRSIPPKRKCRLTTLQQIIAEAAWGNYRAAMLALTGVAYPRYNLSLEECRMVNHLCGKADNLLASGLEAKPDTLTLALTGMTEAEFSDLDVATELLYVCAADAALDAYAAATPRLFSINDAAHAALLAGDEERFSPAPHRALPGAGR